MEKENEWIKKRKEERNKDKYKRKIREYIRKTTSNRFIVLSY